MKSKRQRTEARCACCVAFECGCCALSDLRVDEADVCPDYRTAVDWRYRVLP